MAGASWVIGGVAALGLYGAGVATGWQLRDGDAWRDLGRAETQGVQAAAQQAEATHQADAGHHAEAERIRTVFRTVTREVPVHVTPETAARYGALPVGFVRLHDAAAQGLDVSAVPDPAGRPDGAASDVEPDDAIGVVLANYEVAHQCRATVLGWQDWATRQMAADAGARR